MPDIDHADLTGPQVHPPGAHQHAIAAASDVDVSGIEHGQGFIWDADLQLFVPGESGVGVNERYAVPPSTPHAIDDEFEDDALTGWTRVASPTLKGTWTEQYGRLHYNHNLATAGTELDVQVKADTIAVGDYIEAAVRYENTIAWCAFWLGFSDSATFGSGTCVGTFLHWTGSTYRWMLNTYPGFQGRTQDGTISDRWLTGKPIYVRVRYEAANTFGLYRSLNGIQWTAVQTNYVRTLTPTHVTVGIAFLGGGVGGEMEIFAFRKNAA